MPNVHLLLQAEEDHQSQPHSIAVAATGTSVVGVQLQQDVDTSVARIWGRNSCRINQPIKRVLAAWCTPASSFFHGPKTADLDVHQCKPREPTSEKVFIVIALKYSCQGLQTEGA